MNVNSTRHGRTGINLCHITRTVTALFLFALAALPALGQASPIYTYTAESVVASSGGTFEVKVFLDSSQGTGIGAFSFSVCFDDALMTAQSVAAGSDLATVRFGGPPEIFIFDTGPGYFNVGCVIDVLNFAVLPPSSNYELTRTTMLAAPAVGTSTIVPCAAGLPPVAVVIIETGTGIQTPAAVVGGTVVVANLFGVLALDVPAAPVMGNAFDATVTLTASNAFEGFRFGLGHDAVQVTPLSVTQTPQLDALNGGNGPDQYLVDLAPLAGAGITVDCIFSTNLNITLPAGTTPIATIVYDAAVLSTACSEALFTFRDDLGVPLEIDLPNATELVVGNDLAVAIASIPLVPATGGVTLRVANVTGQVGGSVAVPVFLDADVPVQGFSFSASHSSADYLLTAIEPGLALLAIGCNVGPSFFNAQIPGGGTQLGSVIAAIDIDLAMPTYVLPVASELEIVRLTYQIPAAPSSNFLDIALVDGLGTPPIALEVTAEYLEIAPATVPGGIVLGGGFQRGECNSDGSVNIADAITLLGFLFPGTTPIVITCEDACDGNDDGGLNIADAIFLLNSLFGSQILPEPTTCGEDPTMGDALGCDVSGGC